MCKELLKRRILCSVLLLVFMFGALTLLVSCDAPEDGEIRRETIRGERLGSGESIRFGETFLFNGIEVTLSNDIQLQRLSGWYRDIFEIDGEYAFRIPILLTNTRNVEHSLVYFYVMINSPDGTRSEVLGPWFETDTNILSNIRIQPGATQEGYIYIVDSGNGKYALEFLDETDEGVEFRFFIKFGDEFRREQRNEFALGETLYFLGLEITVIDDISWGTVNFEWSDYFGEIYFYLPVTVYNTTDELMFFPWGSDIIDSHGVQDSNLRFSVTGSMTESDIRETPFEPGESVTRYLYVRYTGDGEYRFAITHFWDEVQVAFHIEADAVYLEQLRELYRELSYSDLARHLTSPQMRSFEESFDLSEEELWSLAFGAFVLTNNQESIRTFALGESRFAAERLLRSSWNITDREGALDQITRLAASDGQSPVADDLFHTLVQAGRLEFISEAERSAAMLALELPPGFESGFDNVLRVSQSRAERNVEDMDVDPEYVDELVQMATIVEFVDRINRGLGAYLGARNLLIFQFGFTEEELLAIPSLAAWDYGRVAILARYGAEVGFLEEEEAWEFLRIAAERASATYSSWREFTAAHILGRALAFGNDSWDFHDALDFLLNHPTSSFQTIDFQGP